MKSLEATTMGKIRVRVTGFLILAFFIAYLERTNVAFAGPQLKRDLGFSATMFGAGVSLFFVTYIAFAVPSTLLLRFRRPHVWICCMLFIWGVISAAMIFIRDEMNFYGLRLLLGAAEAGFVPFTIAYLITWLPEHYRARMMGVFMVGIPLSGVVGGPLCGILVDKMDGLLGMSGWKWMFLVEGVAAVLVGCLGKRVLVEGPGEAEWLTGDERNWLEGQIEADRLSTAEKVSKNASKLLMGRRVAVFLLGIAYALAAFNTYGITFFLPQILSEGSTMSNSMIGFATAVPFLAAAVAMVVIPARADRHGAHHLFAAGTFLCAAFGFVIASLSINIPWLVLSSLTFATATLWASVPLVLALPLKSFPSGSVAPIIAVLTGIGNLGGLAGPAVVGFARDQTGSYGFPLMMFAVAMLLAAIVVISASYLLDGSKKARVEKQLKAMT